MAAASDWASCCSRWTRRWSPWWTPRAGWTCRCVGRADRLRRCPPRPGAAAGSADVFFLLGIGDDEALRWIDDQAASGCRRPSSSRSRPTRWSPRRCRRVGGGRRGTAGPLGTAVPLGQPRLRASRRPRRPAGRLRHRPVRPGPVHRRPHPRHGQHRGRPVARAGLLGLQRRGRRAAPAVDPGPRRPARASGVDRPVGHLRRAAGQRRRGARRRAARTGPAPAAGDRHLPAADRSPAPPVFAGTIWVQQGSQPLADDADDVLRGAAVLAARIMSRLAARPSTHARRVQELLGLPTANRTWPPSRANSASPPTGRRADRLGQPNAIGAEPRPARWPMFWL